MDMEIEDAVNKAISVMPAGFVLRPFLDAHRTEVYGMLLDEYNEAEAMELFKEDGRQEGLEQGRQEGLEQGREEGLEQGREEGLAESARMYKCLKEAGRLDEYDKAMADPDFYKKLKEELKIG